MWQPKDALGDFISGKVSGKLNTAQSSFRSVSRWVFSYTYESKDLICI